MKFTLNYNNENFEFELNSKQKKYLDYVMNSPCLSENIDYEDDSIRLIYYITMALTMPEFDLDNELEFYKGN